jgi:hypothetical protein
MSFQEGKPLFGCTCVWGFGVSGCGSQLAGAVVVRCNLGMVHGHLKAFASGKIVTGLLCTVEEIGSRSYE